MSNYHRARQKIPGLLLVVMATSIALSGCGYIERQSAQTARQAKDAVAMLNAKQAIDKALKLADEKQLDKAIDLLKPLTSSPDSQIRLAADEAVIYSFAVNRNWKMMNAISDEVGQTPRGSADLVHSLGFSLSQKHKFDIAADVFVQSAEKFKSLTNDQDFLYLRDMANAASCYSHSGSKERAYEICQQIVPPLRRCCHTPYEQQFLNLAEFTEQRVSNN